MWRQEIDVNGDGRIDIIDAAEEAGHWVVPLAGLLASNGSDGRSRSHRSASLL